MIEVILLGRGGVMPLAERGLTSLYLRYNGKAILIDCGEATQIELRKNKAKYSEIDAILFTHLHADHICGITGFLLTLGLEGRTAPLRIYGPRGIGWAISTLTAVGPALTYPLEIIELSDETEFSEIGLRLNAFPLLHSVDCFGYRMELPRLPRFDPERARALGIPVRLWKILQRGESAEGFEPADVTGGERKGLSVLYVTDTRPVEAISRYGAGVDLMVLEGMYGEADGAEKAAETTHMTMQEAARIAAECGCGELWLTHYSPSVKDPLEYESEIKGIFANTEMGETPISCVLKFE